MSVNVKTSEGLTKIANNVSIVQANWNETDEGKSTCIKNKPEVLTTMEEVNASTYDDLVGATAVKELNNRLILTNANSFRASMGTGGGSFDYMIFPSEEVAGVDYLGLALRTHIDSPRMQVFKCYEDHWDVVWDSYTPKTFTATAYGLTLSIYKVGKMCEWKLTGKTTQELSPSQYYNIADLLGTGFEPAQTYINFSLFSSDFNGQIQARKSSATDIKFQIGFFKKIADGATYTVPKDCGIYTHGIYMSAN